MKVYINTMVTHSAFNLLLLLILAYNTMAVNYPETISDFKRKWVLIYFIGDLNKVDVNNLPHTVLFFLILKRTALTSEMLSKKLSRILFSTITFLVTYIELCIYCFGFTVSFFLTTRSQQIMKNDFFFLSSLPFFILTSL